MNITIDEARASAAKTLKVIHQLAEHSTPEEIVGRAIALYAVSFDGMEETGTTNRNAIIDEWNAEMKRKPGDPWCVIFAQHCVYAVCKALGKPDLLPYDTAGTQALADYHEKRGLLTIDTRRATPGSLIVRRDGPVGSDKGKTGHMEILVDARELTYDSVGGNTNSEHSRDGGDVGIHMGVRWTKYGPVGAERDGMWMRGIIPIEALVKYHWK